MLPWVAAIVARDDTSITVATGIDSAICGEPTRSPEATITHQDETQVVISVTTRIVRAEEDECAITGDAAPAFVSLQEPLGHRVLRDAAALPHPNYYERDVPDLLADKRWDPSGGHLRTDERWFQSFRDPRGTMLLLDAQPTTRAHRSATIATFPIRSQQGIITRYGAAGSWTVWWEVGRSPTHCRSYRPRVMASR
ncbi:hypothetical protein ACGFIP_04860 [Micromonospora zamorensis]|uniref:hypothetical protein n=1 Tax=Micromonospora zamorensis TaxID=709883 RepID=UPI00371FB2E3